MSKPLVSIIIPTFNYAHLITETLESVLSQTYKHWECIIVDDGSVVNTEEVVEAFINRHLAYAFTYIKKNNEGTSVAKNTGLKVAAGAYIQFLDADDLISPDKLAIQALLFERGAADLIFSKSIFFKAENSDRVLLDKYPEGFLANQTLNGYELLRSIVKNNIVTIGSPLVKKTVLFDAGLFDADLSNNEDWLLWFKIALLIRSFVYDNNDKSFASIRVHNQSAMHNYREMFNGEVTVRRQIELELSKLDPSKDINLLRKLNSDLLALHHVRSLNVSTGMKYILSSFVKNPVAEFNLFSKALLKLGVRAYKSAIS